MIRSSGLTAAVAIVGGVALLSGCSPSTVEPRPNPSASAEASETSTPSPTASATSDPQPTFALGTLTGADLTVMESGCAIQLMRDADPADLVMYEGAEKAILRIDGALLQFTHDAGSSLGDPVTRSFTEATGTYTLSVDTPFGEPSPETDSTAIPAATITITPTGGESVAVEVSGGVAC
ncbi:MAG: hypothetical protein RI885_1670 [Actinomycetota bacterium]|jgi:hypothetical protein